ncbi:hypothetical protein GDO81_025036 [Engystomops pustulosus]|uniref:Uncharacterized protein n=1 Tax=Engystomops pustulosus TaxID=76066 RepID=A0AAV6YPL6_ENGPU|nr:hypothetical protein GDO81_025036 [Engystomops pustulosus]
MCPPQLNANIYFILHFLSIYYTYMQGGGQSGVLAIKCLLGKQFLADTVRSKPRTSAVCSRSAHRLMVFLRPRLGTKGLVSAL